MQSMPVVFVGHGSPMNIIENNEFTRSLSNLGAELPEPEAILVISAHWFIRETSVACTEAPETIYDFYGFPGELYELTYGCRGSPEYASEVKKLVKKTDVRLDDKRGLDHGAWSILRHMYPKADIPAFQLSIDSTKDAKYHYELAKELVELRNRGVLIIGSGNVVHNLRIIDYDMYSRPREWAVEFDQLLKAKLLEKDYESLINYESLGKTAKQSIPTEDHYLPLIYAIALQQKGEMVTFIHEGIQHGTISMRCLKIE
ncbi:MAG: 4,5-DOPA dioxygenase extradiol [Candidatus Odinarchaeota archaeon]